jgi:NADH-quinone oxidoreductase subunit J
MEIAFFYLFGGISLAGAVAVIALRNALSSAMALVVTLFSVACLFALAGADFLAAMQVLVYAGAIMVLFVFVVMFLNLARETIQGLKITFSAAVGILFGVIFGLFMALQFGYLSVPLAEGERGTVQEIGRLLFTDFIVPFELVSLLLLIAIVGAVYFGKKEIS